MSHCFNLTGDDDPTITGLDNLLEHYREGIKGTKMWGPTLFATVFRMILEYMNQNIHLPMYHILLILTDGCIHDLRETIDLIVECTSFPLSIIIVGIGDEDFTMMEKLDSDEYVLVDGFGNEAKRDICQFVKLNEFKEKAEDGTWVTMADKLAEAVLNEVPD